MQLDASDRMEDNTQIKRKENIKRGPNLKEEDTEIVKNAIRERRKKSLQKIYIIAFTQRVILLVMILTIVFTQIFGIYTVHNNDMQPKLMHSDIILCYRLDRSFKNQNVVVYTVESKKYIGRIIAVGGDTIEITDDGVVKINGDSIIESNIFYPTTTAEDVNIEYPITIPENMYFIMSDYREVAKDSRYFGPISVNQIQGEVITAIRRGDI